MVDRATPRKHILYLEAAEMGYDHGFPFLHYGRRDVVKALGYPYIITLTNRYSASPDLREEQLFRQGRDPDSYELSTANFSDAPSFLDAIVSAERPIDELVVHAHGHPLYIEGDTLQCPTVPHGIPLEELRHRRDELRHTVTVDDLECDPEIVALLRAQFSDEAIATMWSCQVFRNLNHPANPVFGSELARLLDIPVTGPVHNNRYLMNRDNGGIGIVAFSARAVATAHPTTDGVRIMRIDGPWDYDASGDYGIPSEIGHPFG